MVQLTPDELAGVVLARQRRGVGVTVLGVTSAALWVLAAAWTVFLWVEYPNKVVSKLRQPSREEPWVRDTQPKPPGAKPPAANEKPPEPPTELVRLLGARGMVWAPDPPSGYRQRTPEEQAALIQAALYDTTWGLVWAVGQLAGIAATLLAALLSTLALVFVSRRSTLRQVRAVLADIATDLAALRLAPTPG